MSDCTTHFQPFLTESSLPPLLNWLAAIAAMLTTALGVLVLVGWALQIDILMRVLPGLVAMKPNTAFGFVLAGAALYLLRPQACSVPRKRAGQIVASFLVLLGTATLSQYLTGFDLGIDRMLFAERPGAPLTLHLGRMAPNTAVTFILVGLALLFLDFETRRGWRPAQLLSLAGAFVGLVCILGYAYRVTAFYRVASATPMALHTSVGFFVVSMGVLLARSGRGLTRTFMIQSAEGSMARRLLPVAVGVPILLGRLLIMGEAARWYEPSFGTALFVVGSATIFMIILFFSTQFVHRADESRARLAAIVESSDDAIIGNTLDGIIQTWNAGAERIFGYSAQEVKGRPVSILLAPDHLEDAQSILNRIQKGASVEHFETVRVNKGGRRVYVSLTVSPVRDAAGKLVGTSTIARDITGRKRAEEALRESQEHYRSLFKNMTTGLAYCEMLFADDGRPMDFRYLDVNEVFKGLTGLKDVVGRKVSEVIPGIQETDRELLETYGRVAKTGQPEKFETFLKALGIFFSVSVYSPKKGFFVAEFDNITERKRAQEAVEAERRKLNEILDMLPAYLVLLSQDYHVPFANRFFRERFGESHGRRCYEYLFGRNEPCEVCETYKVLKNWTPLRWDWTGPDGRNYSIFDFPFTDTDGSRLIMEVGLDITEHKRAEEALRRANAYNRSLIEASLDPLVTIAPDGKITDVNTATEKVTGRSRQELVGTDFSDYFTNSERARAGYQQVFREGWVQNYALEIRHRDGRLTPVLYNASVYRDDAGQIIGVFAAARDITERKQAQEALRQSETEFRMLAELVPQLVWMCKPDGLNVYFNQRWVDYTGLTLEESYGKGWNTPFHPDDRQPAWKAWNHAVETGDTYSIECRLRRVDGIYRWFLIRGVPLRDATGGTTKWFGTCTDIEELKSAQEAVKSLNSELEERVRQRTAELESTNKELEAFTYSVSHDLRAPLRHVDGYSKLLVDKHGAELSPDAQEDIATIRDSVLHMGMLIDDLLNLARLGRKQISIEATGLNSLVDEVRADLMRANPDRAIEWKVENLPFVECDPALIKQVFANLLSNAVKYTRPRKQAVIEVGTTQQEGCGVIFVRDNGVGFNMKYANKLFGVFQRLHRSEDFEGTGVGLATVQRIIHKHRGRVWVEAALNQGATFYFTLNASGQEELESEIRSAAEGRSEAA